VSPRLLGRDPQVVSENTFTTPLGSGLQRASDLSVDERQDDSI
jgi:hypothetical protein